MAGKMAREKIKIRKIDNITARQVTFSKTRRGIFKKAEELSILCDADIALIIFSTTGKLFDFSSSRMKDILARYSTHTKNEERRDGHLLELQLENNNLAELNKVVANKKQELRKLKGEDLQGVDLEELIQLERMLEGSLSRVLHTKGKRIENEIETLQRQGNRLMEENQMLKQKMIEISQGKWPVLEDQSDTSTVIHEEGGQSSESDRNGGPSITEDDSSDTSLKLGL